MNLLDLPSVERATQLAQSCDSTYGEAADALRQFAALIQLFKVNEGTPETDELVGNDAQPKFADWQELAKRSRTLETTKNVLAALARVRAATIDQCAKLIRKEIDSILENNAYTESDTNATVFRNEAAESLCNALDEIEEAIRALPPTEGKKS